MKNPIILSLAVAIALQAPICGSEDHAALASSFSEEYLDSLLAPLALHPDPLVALILPASTAPTDIVLAARYLRSGGAPGDATDRGWDESVVALLHYPEIVYWLDEKLEWTAEVGDAFLVDPAGVMNAIQRLRTRARLTGALSTTHQQRVVFEDEYISILPASTRVIHVPVYDPAVVYVQRPTYGFHTFLRFGFAYPVGNVLRYDCDWQNRRVWRFNHPHRPGEDWGRRRADFGHETPPSRHGGAWSPGAWSRGVEGPRRATRVVVAPAIEPDRAARAAARGTWTGATPRRAERPAGEMRSGLPGSGTRIVRVPSVRTGEVPASGAGQWQGIPRRRVVPEGEGRGRRGMPVRVEVPSPPANRTAAPVAPVPRAPEVRPGTGASQSPSAAAVVPRSVDRRASRRLLHER